MGFTVKIRSYYTKIGTEKLLHLISEPKLHEFAVSTEVHHSVEKWKGHAPYVEVTPKTGLPNKLLNQTFRKRLAGTPTKAKRFSPVRRMQTTAWLNAHLYSL
jgi:hypothetical protein